MEPTLDLIQSELLGRIAQHDLQALSEFYDLTVTPLFSVALRILNDTGEAEEVIQDVFIQVWDKAPNFDTRLGSAFHWVLGITRHRAIDRLRKRQRQAQLIEELLQSDMSQSVSAMSPDFEAEGMEQTTIVRAAVANLPKDQREAIELAFFRGLTHPEIAQTLKEPLGTVKARIRRGLLKLRECLPMKK